ncbi:MAG: hypothetical protein NVSMB1_09870 [Polyangiales bacterium]
MGVRRTPSWLRAAGTGWNIFPLVSLAACSIACSDRRDLSGTANTDAAGFQPGDATNNDDGGLFDLEAGLRYAVLGVQPSHGPFTGGTRIELRGRGFSSQTKVRLGPIDVPAVDVVARDPFHVQLVTPPGDVGPTDVIATDPVTLDKALLTSGFTYDAYYADPNAGSTAGGTHVSLIGRGTSWGVGTTVTIDGKSCGDVVIVDATHLRCVAPADTPGLKSITVTTADAVVATVRDAYTYADTDDGYRGGLSGAKLPGELRVLAIANADGSLIPGATVVVRGSEGAVQTGSTNDSGLASFPAPPAAPLTVTIAKKCIQPVTFDGVRVRSVTAYLDPVLSVACIPPGSNPPPTGGKTINGGLIGGELVWKGGEEFKRAPWKGIAAVKKKTERAAAYVFVAGQNNLAKFELPPPSSATLETSPGTVGYQYQLVVYPGNNTLYAIAGIEDRPLDGTPPSFEPYVYGITRGVGVKGGGTVDNVLIPMTGSFTHEVRFHIDAAPTSPRGPDRLQSSLAINIGEGYMLLPFGKRNDLLPLGSDLSFVGVPPLSGALGTSVYTAAVEDVTGGAGGMPMSAVLRYRSRNDDKPIVPGPFVPIPKLVYPTVAKAWDGQTIKLDLPDKSADLLILGVSASDGSAGWTIIAPGDTRAITLPDFSSQPDLGLPPGDVLVGITAARLDPFVYDDLRYGQLSRRAFQSFAADTMIAKW